MGETPAPDCSDGLRRMGEAMQHGDTSHYPVRPRSFSLSIDVGAKG